MGCRESTRCVIAQTAILALILTIIVLPGTGVAATGATSVTVTATVPGATGGGGEGGGSSGSGGGGGGGGGGSVVPKGKATVVFTGRAYPGSTVTILQNGTRRGTTISGSDATFGFTLESVPAGSHTFALYSTDRRGIRSAMQTYPLKVTGDLITTVSGIFIAPTISLTRDAVQKGEPITVLGQTAPTGDVTISVHSNHALTFLTKADTAGLYSYTFLTHPLEEGSHEVQARTAVQGAVSGPSATAKFRVGKGQSVDSCLGGDLNCDSRVNLVDFSIIAFWFKKTGPPAHVDLNGDGSVTLVDFSIMAYRWTG